jgi:hypothetical protein
VLGLTACKQLEAWCARAINLMFRCFSWRAPYAQVGEALQVQSGGMLRATPHYVRACDPAAAAGVSRSTFALFMQPDVTFHMNAPPGVGGWVRKERGGGA